MPRKKREKPIKYNRRWRNDYTRNVLTNDLASTHPVGGKFLKVGKSEILLVKTQRTDSEGNPMYLGTIVKRNGFMKRKVNGASHVVIKPL